MKVFIIEIATEFEDDKERILSILETAAEDGEVEEAFDTQVREEER